MKFIVLIFLVQFCFAKEQEIYKADGGGLFDLIRGIPPKEGSLEFKKVEQTDTGALPDGIYFIPDGPVEDEAIKVNVTVRPLFSIHNVKTVNIVH